MIQRLAILLQWGPHTPQGPHGPMGPHWGGAWGPGTGGWFAGLGPLLWVLTLAVLLIGAYLLFRAVTERDGRPDALAVLERRYARGDIDDEEFAARRTQLADEP